MIARQANHLARLVDDLLDVARVTSGKVRLQREAVDDRRRDPRSASTTLADRARARGITVMFAATLGRGDRRRHACASSR